LALFDRDYRSKVEMDKFLADMQAEGIKCLVFERKEIENYVLSRETLTRAIEKRQDQRLIDSQKLSRRQIERLILVTSEQFKHETHSQIASQRAAFLQRSRTKLDASTIHKETAVAFERGWRDLDTRLTMLPGKEFIAQLSARLQKTKGFSITVNMLVDEMSISEVPADLKAILAKLDDFCRR
ncbi:MAG: hypothetical protein KIT82_21590, partial [Bradyrhizobium sp.]|nr:hypothetical protein [Bradyrhizobium sp.]